MTIAPFAPVLAEPPIAGLPKADLHLHQEFRARHDQIAAGRQARPPYDWIAWARRLMAETPPGMARLAGSYAPESGLNLAGVVDDGATFTARVATTLEEEAADGAVLVEVRFGADQLVDRRDFMALFRAAERRVQAQYPDFCAAAIGHLSLVGDPDGLRTIEGRLEACIRAASEGFAGVDFLVNPYDTEADPALWAVAYRWAARARDAGLGITVHAGEFSPANLQAALRVPGLGRLGHAVYAATNPGLLEQLARCGATVECSLTCNVILGAVPSYEAHPIQHFVAAGIPVPLNTDLPLHVGTTIGREYAIAAALGFSPAALGEFTRNTVRASFTAAERRARLLALLG